MLVIVQYGSRKTYFFINRINVICLFLVSNNSRILDLGCGNGDLLASLEPSRGVGIDFSEKAIDIARKEHPEHTFYVADVENKKAIEIIDEKFDFIILSDTIGSLVDCQKNTISASSLMHQRNKNHY